MRIALVDPPHKLFPGLRMWAPSFGLLSIAAYLREQQSFPVEILDCTTFSDPWGELARRIGAEKPELVGVTCSATCLSPEALETIRLVKRLSPHSVVVAGGGHFSLVAEEVLSEVPALDYVVVGEGEATFFRLLNNLLPFVAS